MSAALDNLRLSTRAEQDAALQLRTILAARQSSDLALHVVVPGSRKPAEVTLTPALSELLIELLDHIGRGDAISLISARKLLTTQQAADILNVSRPYLIGLLEKGELPFTTVGKHRRVKANDLLSYKEQRDKRRGEILADMARTDGELL